MIIIQKASQRNSFTLALKNYYFETFKIDSIKGAKENSLLPRGQKAFKSIKVSVSKCQFNQLLSQTNGRQSLSKK
jgi:hypothetical protein